MKITETNLRKVIQRLIVEHDHYENEEGDIHPEFMEMFEWYQWAIIHMLEYWEGWKGLCPKFIEGQVKNSFRRNDIPSDVGFEKKHDPDLFNRALFELVGADRIREFWGNWNPRHDLDRDRNSDEYVPEREARYLYILPKGHKYQDDFVPYALRRK